MRLVRNALWLPWIGMTSLLLLGLSTSSFRVSAWDRVRISDAELCNAADVIAVAHVREGSIECCNEERHEEQESSTDHGATIKIDRLLKGKVPTPEVQIILAHGLTPTIGGIHGGHGEQISAPATSPTSTAIQIWDTGSSLATDHPIAILCESQNIWFLRRIADSAHPHNGALYLSEPCQVQPARYAQYYSALLGPNSQHVVDTLIIAGFPVMGDDDSQRNLINEVRERWTSTSSPPRSSDPSQSR